MSHKRALTIFRSKNITVFKMLFFISALQNTVFKGLFAGMLMQRLWNHCTWKATLYKNISLILCLLKISWRTLIRERLHRENENDCYCKFDYILIGIVYNCSRVDDRNGRHSRAKSLSPWITNGILDKKSVNSLQNC